MVYNGGAVLPNTTTYAIWWGQTSDFPPDASQGLDAFLESLDESNYLALADQYMFGARARTRFRGNLFDYSPPPTATYDASGNDLMPAEACKVLAANNITPDSNAVYVIFTSNYPEQLAALGACAYHGYGACPGGTIIHTALVPNFTGALSACGTNEDPLFTPSRHTEGTRAMVSTTAHEFMEAITDPNFDAWYSSNGSEVGDPCAYVYVTPVQLDGGSWKLQDIWSNQANGCAQGAGRGAKVIGAVSQGLAATAFDIPSGELGIFGKSINRAGSITGFYADASNSWHGFVRTSQGKIANIDVPGATNTVGSSINANGFIGGQYIDTNFVVHGFVRDSSGNIATIDAPGSVYATVVQSINDAGSSAGYSIDGNFVSHGFVGDSAGNISTFDVRGSGNSIWNGTKAVCINAHGAVIGNYTDADFISHGFVRDADGQVATFDAPGAALGTFAQSINADGAVVGYYTDSSYVSHGFLRDSQGNIAVFDDPHSTTGTFALTINAKGTVAGYYTDNNGLPQGFLRDKYGSFFALTAMSANLGNVIQSVNDAGATTGYVTEAAR